jgi:hypothetical protein
MYFFKLLRSAKQLDAFLLKNIKKSFKKNYIACYKGLWNKKAKSLL